MLPLLPQLSWLLPRISACPVPPAPPLPFRRYTGRCSLMTAKGPAPQRGRICMDMSMIDLTDLPGVDVGDEVEIFGPHNPVEVMAAQAGTIPYELTCAVSKRVPRVYLQNGQVTERELLLRF